MCVGYFFVEHFISELTAVAVVFTVAKVSSLVNLLLPVVNIYLSLNVIGEPTEMFDGN